MDKSIQTVVIGGGQAGLAAGYYLAQQGTRFAILDGNLRIGDSWRKRWDSLRLFTPCKFSSLPGLPFPGDDFYFPTKDETANYLEEYAKHFDLPVFHSTKVKGLTRQRNGYQLSTESESLTVQNVIIATGGYQKASIPSFAGELDPAIIQLHSSKYSNPKQLPVQNILVVGAGNSGAEIGLELVRSGKKVWLAGRDVGRIPAYRFGRLLGGKPYWFVISRVLSVNTPVGRKIRSKILHHGTPWIRVTQEEITEAGIERVPRVSGVQSGKLLLEDNRVLPVEGVVWATGFRPNYGWIDLPIFDDYGYPKHRQGIVPDSPGLYFVGLPFQTALSSPLLVGVGIDARYIVRQIAA